MARDPRDPLEIVVRNLFLLQALGNSLSAEIRAQIDELFSEIVSQIAKIDPTGPSLQRWRLARRDKLFDEIQKLTGETFDDIHRALRLRLAQLGRGQSDVAVAHLKAIIGAGSKGKVETVRVTLNQLKAIIDHDPMEGALLKEWAERQGARTAFQVRRQIQLGMTRAETIDQLVRRVRGRSVGRGKYTGGVLEATTREAEALVRTAVTDIANVAALRTFEENRAVTKEYEYVATLDSRTTLICATLDRRRFRYDDPAALRPPQHWNCRSIIVPVVDWKGLGLDPPPEGTRASAGGQVAADTKYSDWLKAQPEGVQNEILGPTRAELFRQGRVSLRDLVRTDGRRVPLRDLPELQQPKFNPQAVRAKGLSKLSTEDFQYATLGEAEEVIFDAKLEHALVFDPDDGPVRFYMTSGKESAVEFSPEQVEKFEGGVLTHNHPGSASLSDADIALAHTTGLAELRAVSSRYTYAIKPGEKLGRWWRAAGDQDGQVTRAHIYRVWREEMNNLHSVYQPKVASGQMSADAAWREHTHRAVARVAERLGFFYQRTPRKGN